MKALESTLLVSQNTSDKLSEELDDQSAELDRLHQYSRRNCIIVSGIPVKKWNMWRPEVLFWKKRYQRYGRKLKRRIWFWIRQFHKHGKVNGTKQNVIVRFRSHQYPSDLYYARKKIKNRNIRLKPSLTKKRTEFLCNETERIKDCNTYGIQFAYADFDGNIKIRLNGIYRERYVHTINSIEHLEEIINEISNSKS